MTTRSSSHRPDDSRIPDAPVAVGIPTPSAHLAMRSAPLLEQQPDASLQEGVPYGGPLHELVHAAVADRPVEDVARLITLLERSPEHARTMADALHTAAVGRSVEDVTRLVTLLTKPPRGSDSADAAIRAAAERRSLEDVMRLMQLLHRTPVEPRCGRTAVRAAAVSRPVEELAELISRLAADRTVPQAPPTEPTPPESAGSMSASAAPAAAPAAPAAAAAATSAAATALVAVPGLKDRPGKGQPANARSVNDPSNGRSVSDRSASVRSVNDRPANDHPAEDRAAGGRPAEDRRAGKCRRDGLVRAASVWVGRGAALLVFLCGVAHAPRYWAGPSQGVLGATVVVAGLCMLLAVALTSRAAQARLVAATAAVGVMAVLTAGLMFGGRFGPPGLSRVWDATLARPWLAGTTAAVAALAALVALVVTLAAGDSRRDGGR